MNTRPLNLSEEQNLSLIRQAGVDCALLFLTETGLQKSILDAVLPLRLLLKEAGLHDYSTQGQGSEAKVYVESILFSRNTQSEVKVSLYRPNTKKGDPRIWFSQLSSVASPNEVLAVGVADGRLTCINLSSSNTADSRSPEFNFLADLQPDTTAATELHEMLLELAAKGPLKAVCKGSTAVGRTIEAGLNITINSSRKPDFKGIEIKSGRAASAKRSETRKTLFACVPDWSLSCCGSSREILEKYGYESDSGFALRCTVSTTRPNSRLLQLDLNSAFDWLTEFAAKHPREEVAVWPLDKLHRRLKEKHQETFWVTAKSEEVGGCEYFTLQSIRHTKFPSMVTFDEFLEKGIITVDHLIKRTPSGGASEKGPLFKIPPKNVEALFLSPAQYYDLT